MTDYETLGRVLSMGTAYEARAAMLAEGVSPHDCPIIVVRGQQQSVLSPDGVLQLARAARTPEARAFIREYQKALRNATSQGDQTDAASKGAAMTVALNRLGAAVRCYRV